MTIRQKSVSIFNVLHSSALRRQDVFLIARKILFTRTNFSLYIYMNARASKESSYVLFLFIEMAKTKKKNELSQGHHEFALWKNHPSHLQKMSKAGSKHGLIKPVNKYWNPCLESSSNLWISITICTTLLFRQPLRLPYLTTKDKGILHIGDFLSLTDWTGKQFSFQFTMKIKKD